MIRFGMLFIGMAFVGLFGGHLTALQGYGICMLISGIGFFVDPTYRPLLRGAG